MTVQLLTGRNFPRELMDALGLPEHTKSFTLRVDSDSFAEIDVTYYPHPPQGTEPITETFNLVKKEQQ